MLKRLIGIVLLSLLITPFVLTHAQTPEAIECAEDLRGQTVQFYHFGDLSGAYSVLTLPVLEGFNDAIQYFNENGGLCGAEITMEYRDTGGTQEAAQAAWDEFTAREDANLMFVYLTEDAELLRDQAAEQNIPIVVSSGSVKALYGDQADTPGWVFSVTPLYPNQLGAFCDYVAANWSDFGIEGDPVIGHVSFLGALGQSSDTPEAQAYCASKGVGYAGAMYYFPIIPDITVQVQTVLDAGANILYTTSVGPGPARLATTLQQLEVRDQVVIGGPNIVLDSSTVSLGGEAVAGLIGQLPYHWWDELDHPGIQIVLQQWAEKRLPQYEGDAEAAYQARNVAYLVAWGAVDAWRKVMARTINRVGYDNLSGTAVYETLTSGEPIGALYDAITITYTATQRDPVQTRMASVQFVETEGGVAPQILPLTDWLTVPDLKPGGADVPE